MEKDPQGKTWKEKCKIKNSILNYKNEIISAPSTTIAIKKEKFHLPKRVSINPKEKKLQKNKIANLHEVYK